MKSNQFKKISIIPLIIIIRFYQYFISPILKNNCRFLPTCSEYTIKSLEEHGLKNGSIISIKRILSCHPFGKDGYDPVPKKNNKRTLNG